MYLISIYLPLPFAFGGEVGYKKRVQSEGKAGIFDLIWVSLSLFQPLLSFSFKKTLGLYYDETLRMDGGLGLQMIYAFTSTIKIFLIFSAFEEIFFQLSMSIDMCYQSEYRYLVDCHKIYVQFDDVTVKNL
jgi:hypothetical protein